MQERRKISRQRAYLGGKIAFNHRHSVVDCLVRDVSDEGAKVECPAAVPMARDVDLIIESKGLEARARMVWRSPTEIGFSFATAPAISGDNVVSIGTARLIAELQAANRELKRRVGELSGSA
jgi:hypothetical protein